MNEQQNPSYPNFLHIERERKLGIARVCLPNFLPGGGFKISDRLQPYIEFAGFSDLEQHYFPVGDALRFLGWLERFEGFALSRRALDSTFVKPRIRASHANGKSTYTLTVKSIRDSSGGRDEYEAEISQEDFFKLAQSASEGSIRKRRYVLIGKGLKDSSNVTKLEVDYLSDVGKMGELNAVQGLLSRIATIDIEFSSEARYQNFWQEQNPFEFLLYATELSPGRASLAAPLKMHTLAKFGETQDCENSCRQILDRSLSGVNI